MAKSLPEEVRDALLTNHPLVRAGRMAADAGEWVADKGKDIYRTVQTRISSRPRRRTGDIYLPPPTKRVASRSVRKR